MANRSELEQILEMDGYSMVTTPGIIPFFPSIMAAVQSDEFNSSECICSDLQHEDYSPLYAWFNYIVIIIMLPSLSAFGVITNAVNVFVYSRCRMRNSSNTYLLFLACSDFFVVVTGLFIFWIDSARSYIPQLVQAPYTTVYTLPFGYMAQSCSIYFTVAAAIDCYICVCWRPLAKRHCTVQRARRIVGCIVLCSVLYNSLRFPQFNLRHCFHEGSKEMIVEICPTTLFFTINTVYNVYLYMFVMTLLPFSVLLILNLVIIWRKSLDSNRLRQKKKNTSPSVASISFKAHASIRSKESQTNGMVTSNRSRRSSFPRGAQIRSHSRPQPHIAAALLGGTLAHFPPLPKATPGSDETITMIMVVVLFLCCNTLALIVNLIETFFEPDALLLNLLSDASNFLVIFNSSVNCVIYLIFNNDYRDVFLMHFVRIKGYLQQRVGCFQRCQNEEERGTANAGRDDRREGRMEEQLTEEEDEEGKWKKRNGKKAKKNQTRLRDFASGTVRSPLWLSHSHHNFCHCPCKCPLLLRCAARLAKEEERDSGCDEEAEGGGTVAGSSSRHQLISSKARSSATSSSSSSSSNAPLPLASSSLMCHHHAPPSSSCYLAEVKIVTANGTEREGSGGGQREGALPHILVCPLMRQPPESNCSGRKEGENEEKGVERISMTAL